MLDHEFLSVCLEFIIVRVLRNDHLDNLDPILMKALDSDLMGTNVVGTEPLHSKIINEPIMLQILNIYHNIIVDKILL